MITITISSDQQGEGKSTLVEVLHCYLESCGCEVVEPNHSHSKTALQLFTHLAPKIKIVDKEKA